MAATWYALQTRPLKEEFVAHQLVSRNYTVFSPSLRVQPVNPRARTVRPFFPGYLFVHADLERVGIADFQYLPHAVGLVCFGDIPAMVEDELIEEIGARLAHINSAGGEIFLSLQPGEQVLIEHGPFAGYEAIFSGRLRDSERVRLLLDLLGRRQIALEIPVNYIRQMR